MCLGGQGRKVGEVLVLIICYYVLAFLKPYLGLEESILDLIPTYLVAKHFNTCAASC